MHETYVRADVLGCEDRPPSSEALTDQATEVTALRLTIPGTLHSEIRDGSHSLPGRLENNDDPCRP